MALEIEATYNVPEAGLLKILGGEVLLLEVEEVGTGRKFEAFNLDDEEGRPIGWAVDVDTAGRNQITLRISYTGRSCEYLFNYCPDLVAVEKAETTGRYFNGLFRGDVALVEVKELDTSEAETISAMFCECESLKRVPALDTRNVIDFSLAFSGCKNLEEVPELDTSNGRYFLDMWKGVPVVPSWAQNRLFRKSGL